jgi:hypothetical protein
MCFVSPWKHRTMPTGATAMVAGHSGKELDEIIV